MNRSDLDPLLANVDPAWHDAFRRLVNQGELDPGFDHYLDAHPRAQEAAEAAVRWRSGKLRDLIREMLADPED